MTESRIAWRRVSRGLLLLGFGVFLLLNTTGYLPWSFWLDAATFWPVLLVALGIRLVFEKSRAPAAILLSPLLVLGTLGVVAWSGEPWPDAGQVPIRLDRDAGIEEWTLDAGLGFADLDVRAEPQEPGVLLSGMEAAGGGRGASYGSGGRSARVRLGRSYHDRIVFRTIPRRRQAWNLSVAPDLPLSLDLALGFSRGELNLEAASVKRVDFSGGFNDLTLRLGAPASSTRLEFHGAFNRIELIVPPETPVSVDTEGLLNLVDGRRGARRLAGPGYRLSAEGAFNSFSVSSP